MIKCPRAVFTIALILAILCGDVFVALADTASSTNFTIESGIINSGGGQFATSTSFGSPGTLGEPALGFSSSTTFRIEAGFLSFIQSNEASTTTQSPPAPPSVSGGGSGTYPSQEIIRVLDFNNDGRVDIADLSVILYYYGRTGPTVARYNLDGSGKVDFVDISILFYYWTG